MLLKSSIQAIIFTALLFKGPCVHTHPNREIINLNIVHQNNPAFTNFLGINGFEWDFFNDANTGPDPQKVAIMKSFGGFRHYLDWERIEIEKGKYTFNPTHSGDANYDRVYKICHDNKITILSCIKNCPPWIVDTYPEKLRGGENVPAPYGLDRSDPQTYIDQAKAAFQFTARYGRNKKVDSALVEVDQRDRWPNDLTNRVKIGLGYVHYIECDNERDKTWKGKQAEQSPEEYAANLSAFYDGNKGKMGKNVGVKNADPSMKVVMGGLAFPNPNFVIRMINWCRKYRGVQADGSVNLCFDIINYHFYNNDATPPHDVRTVGKAPELSLAGKIADDFVNMSKKYANGTDVWITEAGYDVNPASIQRAIKIGDKSALITQADWMLRSAFLYARHGLKMSFFYMLDDVNVNDSTPFSSSGFVDNKTKRPVVDYFIQAKKLLGAYGYQTTISKDPIVDVYATANKSMYVLYVPDEINRKAIYHLRIPGCNSIKIYQLVPGSSQMRSEIVPVTAGDIKLKITETPIFVEKIS